MGHERSGEVAPGSIRPSIDYSEVFIVGDSTLTHEEKVSVMNEALARSLSKFELSELGRRGPYANPLGKSYS